MPGRTSYSTIAVPAGTPPGICRCRYRAHRPRNNGPAQKVGGLHSGYESSAKESRPPFFTSRWFRVTVAAAVLAGAGAFAGTTYHVRCDTWNANLSWTGSECIGVSDGSTELFQPSDEAIRQVEQTVVAQNETAAAMHASAPQRPYITIVDLQATTSADNTTDGLTTERESLEGVAVAQQRQLDKADNNPLYFQVAPQNRREAAMVAAFALQRLAQDPTLTKSVRVYYSDDVTDTYSANLRQDVMHAFASQGFHTSAIPFTPSLPLGPTSYQQTGDTLIGNAVAAGRDTCGYHGFVFFAGRGVPDYGDFLSGAEQCANTAVFIGDDDVSRYVANSALRGQYSVPYYYVSFAPAPMASPPGVEHDFYTELRSLFPFEQQPSQDRSLDGHAALSYDAALVVITATEYLREGPTVLPVTPGNV
jgi:hypothetical protein